METASQIDIICRQTNYTGETAAAKLLEFNNDHVEVIKNYMGVKPKDAKHCVYASQERYKIMRTELDKAYKRYREMKEL